MNREEIKKIIPHREPMLLVDEAFQDEDGAARGKYTVRGDEWFLQGHFPGNPIVPGVVLCEMAAQCCAVLFAGAAVGKTPLYAGLNNVKFKRPVKPGDTVEFILTVEKIRGPFFFTKGRGFVNGEICLSGEFSFALV